MSGITWPLFPAEVTDRYEREDQCVNNHHRYSRVMAGLVLKAESSKAWAAAPDGE